MKYTQSHEWVQIVGDIATVGITDFAQKELGDVVYVDLPRVGHIVKAEGEAVVLESTKAAVDVYSPLSGEILEVNRDLMEFPQKINTHAETEGWLYRLRMTNPQESVHFMNEESYQSFLSN